MNLSFRRIARHLMPARVRFWLNLFFFPERHVVLYKQSLGYHEDGVYTVNTAPFLADELFARAYAAGEGTGSWYGSSVRWRAYIACWSGQHVSQLAGDFVECGVNRGGLAFAMVNYLQFERLDKRFFLIDTFSGLVPEYLNEAERQKGLLEHYAYYKENSAAEVAKTFVRFPNVKVIQGAVPDVLTEVPTERVAYLSLDMNCTMPEIKAAEYFWERLVPGGIILLDDYTQKLHSEQQLAFDEFARQRGVSVLALPTGQGMIFKPS